MRALGFFAQAVANSEVVRLYVSQGVSQPGIVNLLQSFQYTKLPSVIWDSSTESEIHNQSTEDDIDRSRTNIFDSASSGAVRRGKF